MAQALRRAGRTPSRCTESGLDQSELNQITATWYHSHGHFVMLEIDQIWPKGSNDLCLAESGGLEWARAEGLTPFLHSAKLINTRSRQQICAGDISEDSENNAFASESVPSESVPTKIQFARGIIIIGKLQAASWILASDCIIQVWGGHDVQQLSIVQWCLSIDRLPKSARPCLWFALMPVKSVKLKHKTCFLLDEFERKSFKK